jgi:hypothetical protein
MQFGYRKTQNLMLISNPLKKLKKLIRKKFINEKELEFLTFMVLCAKVFG